MSNIPTTQLLFKAQTEFEKGYADIIQVALQNAINRLDTAARADGTIPPALGGRIISETQDDIQRLMVGETGLPISANGTPLSPYSRLLVQVVGDVENQVLATHSNFIASRLNQPTVNWLRSASFGELTPTYDPLHLWVDPAGYRLSDRIWNTTLAARQKIDKYLTFNIQTGTSARRMARELENMLLPNRVPTRTTRPYGVNVSYDAMRLARTEISRAHTEMTFIASEANPFVTGMDWALSARHPRVDICDKLATIGMQGQRVKEPYPIGEAPHVVDDSHPHCLCTNRPYVDNEKATILTIEERLARRRPAPVTPIDPERFKQAVTKQ